MLLKNPSDIDITEKLSLSLDVGIRSYVENDLDYLQWAGATEYRSVFIDTYQRYLKSEVKMLIAETNKLPVGLLWIDISNKASEGVGVFYALQVIWILRSKGIGTYLISSGIEILRQEGFGMVELAVKKDNLRAKKLYEFLGFRVIKDEMSVWEYVDPKGIQKQVSEDVWVMRKRV